MRGYKIGPCAQSVSQAATTILRNSFYHIHDDGKFSFVKEKSKNGFIWFVDDSGGGGLSDELVDEIKAFFQGWKAGLKSKTRS